MRDGYIVEVLVRNTFKGCKILEVGSGGGGMAVEVARRAGCTVYGVDRSRFSVMRARSRARAEGLSDKVIFEVQKAESLSFPSEFFDLAYNVRTLHETEALEALREMYRVLKNYGKIIVVDWVKGSKTWTFESYFTPEEVEDLMRRADFRIMSLELLNDLMLVIAEKQSEISPGEIL